MHIAVLGGGNFGTCLAHVLAKSGHDAHLVLRDENVAKSINTIHENSKYLSGIKLCERIKATTQFEVLTGCEYWIIALPCQKQAELLPRFVPYFGEMTTLINVAKGIDLKKLLPLSMVVPQIFGLEDESARYAVLSGPSFAKEVALDMPTACTLACADESRAVHLRDIFTTPYFRCYSSTDVLGVELGGAIKNIYAIAAGVSDGLNYGDNARASLVTRGLVEMCRLGLAMGANFQTFMGLSGIGDLMLTCNGDLSRNRQVGLRLGKGEKIDEIIASMNSVAEGVATTHAVYAMAQNLGVEMPIAYTMKKILDGEFTPQDGLQYLLSREQKPERF